MAIYDDGRKMEDPRETRETRIVASDPPSTASPFFALVVLAALAVAGWFGYDLYNRTHTTPITEITAPASTTPAPAPSTSSKSETTAPASSAKPDTPAPTAPANNSSTKQETPAPTTNP